ncbi:unnamed protein product, partial [Polarella glacialis]
MRECWRGRPRTRDPQAAMPGISAIARATVCGVAAAAVSGSSAQALSVALSAAPQQAARRPCRRMEAFVPSTPVWMLEGSGAGGGSSSSGGCWRRFASRASAGQQLPATSARAVLERDGTSPQELLESKDFEELLRGGFSKDKLMDFFSQRPLLLARRVVEVGGVLWNAQKVWKNPDLEATRGEVLRKGLVQLGPVFVKVGQTLAQRADIVGAEFARELKSLQMDASPFSNEYAHRVILEDLGHRGPLAPDLCPEGCDPSLPPLFASISRLPVAAASLGQVYQARTHEGLLLAVKVQRPGVARSVALDWACLYLGTGIYRAIR